MTHLDEGTPARRLVVVLWATSVMAACSGGAASTEDAGSQDAEDRDVALVDGGDGGASSSDAVCVAMFDALDDHCDADSDCTVVVHERCSFQGEGTSPALGVRRTALATARDVVEQCAPPFFGCQGEGIAPAPVVSDDGVVQVPGMSSAAACRAGRCVTFQTICGPELCGNGSVDWCTVDEGLAGTRFTRSDVDDLAASREPCDGLDLSQTTCELWGYASGAVSCDPTSCLLQAAECVVCAASDRNLACETGLWNEFREHAIATSDEEIVVVGTALHGGESLRFARLSRDLAVLSDETVPFWLNGFAVAAHPQGWVVAGEGATGVVVHVFDRAGQHDRLAQTFVDTTSPTLTARPGAAPLLTYTLDGSRQATLLSLDLETHTPPVEILGDSWGEGEAPVFVGDVFLVPARNNVPEFVIARVELDGTLSPTRASLQQTGTLVVNDIGVMFVMEQSMFQIDPETLSLVTDELPLADEMGWPLGAPIGWGPEVLFPVVGVNSADVYRNELVAIDLQGMVARRLLVAAEPGRSTAVTLAAIGPDVVLAWASGPSPLLSAFLGAAAPHGFALARVAP